MNFFQHTDCHIANCQKYLLLNVGKFAVGRGGRLFPKYPEGCNALYIKSGKYFCPQIFLSPNIQRVTMHLENISLANISVPKYVWSPNIKKVTMRLENISSLANMSVLRYLCSPNIYEVQQIFLSSNISVPQISRG